MPTTLSAVRRPPDHNGTRQARAQLRRAEVARLLATLGLRHGTQVVIARRLGVSEATISRDLTALFRGSRPRRCPLWVRVRRPRRPGWDDVTGRLVAGTAAAAGLDPDASGWPL